MEVVHRNEDVRTSQQLHRLVHLGLGLGLGLATTSQARSPVVWGGAKCGMAKKWVGGSVGVEEGAQVGVRMRACVHLCVCVCVPSLVRRMAGGLHRWPFG